MGRVGFISTGHRESYLVVGRSVEATPGEAPRWALLKTGDLVEFTPERRERGPWATHVRRLTACPKCDARPLQTLTCRRCGFTIAPRGPSNDFQRRPLDRKIQ